MLVGCWAPPGKNGVKVVEGFPDEVWAEGKLHAELSNRNAAARIRQMPRGFILLVFDVLMTLASIYSV
jgi:hypothetical protein